MMGRRSSCPPPIRRTLITYALLCILLCPVFCSSLYFALPCISLVFVFCSALSFALLGIMLFSQNSKFLSSNHHWNFLIVHWCTLGCTTVYVDVRLGKGTCQKRFSGIRPLRGYPPPPPLNGKSSGKKEGFFP